MSSALTHLASPLTYLVGLLIVGGLLFLLASFAFGRGERLAQMPPDVSPVVLPAARRVTGRDLRRLRMSVVLRGYRMSEVDWILDQLAEQIDERDRELARLRGGPDDPARPDQAPAETEAQTDPALDDQAARDDQAAQPHPADPLDQVGEVDRLHQGERVDPVDDVDRLDDQDRIGEGRHG